MRGRPGRGEAGGPGTPDSTGARSPETGTGGLPFRVRPTRRPQSSDIAAHGRVILSDHDLAVIQEALVAASQDDSGDRQDAAAGQHGTGPGPGPPSEEPRKTWPPEPWCSAVRRLDENRTRRRRRFLFYALAAASIVVAAVLADRWGVLPRVGANTSASPAQVGGPAQRPPLLPPLGRPPVMHFSNAVDATSAPAERSAQLMSPAAEPSGVQNPAARPTVSPIFAVSPRSVAGESSGGGPSTIARGG